MKKICRKCGKEKDISEFRRDSRLKDGHKNICKICTDSTHEHICEKCGKVFRTGRKDSRFCSYKCMGKSNEKQIKFNCDYCGKEASMAHCFYYKSKHHYCSNECRAKGEGILRRGEKHPNWRGGLIKINCDYCGKEIYVNNYENEKSNHHYCSTECLGKHRRSIQKGENNPNWRGGLIKVNCDYCGKEIYKTRHQIKKDNNHYCSMECSHIARGKKIRGENHYNWNPNLTDEERILNRDYEDYKKWRNSVFERDKYICRICKSDNGDKEAHHLNGYDNFKNERLDINNGVTLCKKCHKEFHVKYGYGDNTLQQFKEFYKKETNKEFKIYSNKTKSA